jgi:hypothetical protein
VKPEPSEQPEPLVCDKCGVASPPGAHGWRGYLTDDDAVAVFCRECSAREFDEAIE